MIKKIFTYFLFLLFFISCKKENSKDCFKPNGKEVTEVRTPGSFTSIELNDKIELNISYGPETKVEVTSGKNIIKNIVTEVKDGILKIANNNKCNFVRGYKRKTTVNVTMPYIYSVLNNSVSKIEIKEGFEQDSVRIRAESSGDIHLNGKFYFINSHSNGNGDIYLEGSCTKLFVFTNGTNFLNAGNLDVSDYAYVITLGIGDCHVNAEHLNQLDYLIIGEGNVYYKGIPKSLTGSFDPAAKGKILQEN